MSVAAAMPNTILDSWVPRMASLLPSPTGRECPDFKSRGWCGIRETPFNELPMSADSEIVMFSAAKVKEAHGDGRQGRTLMTKRERTYTKEDAQAMPTTTFTLLYPIPDKLSPEYPGDCFPLLFPIFIITLYGTWIFFQYICCKIIKRPKLVHAKATLTVQPLPRSLYWTSPSRDLGFKMEEPSCQTADSIVIPLLFPKNSPKSNSIPQIPSWLSNFCHTNMILQVQCLHTTHHNSRVTGRNSSM